MRKIKIRTPKNLRIPKGTPVILVPPSLYYIKHTLAQEKAERQQFWENVWEGLKIVTASEATS